MFADGSSSFKIHSQTGKQMAACTKMSTYKALLFINQCSRKHCTVWFGSCKETVTVWCKAVTRQQAGIKWKCKIQWICHRDTTHSKAEFQAKYHIYSSFYLVTLNCKKKLNFFHMILYIALWHDTELQIIYVWSPSVNALAKIIIFYHKQYMIAWCLLKTKIRSPPPLYKSKFRKDSHVKTYVTVHFCA